MKSKNSYAQNANSYDFVQQPINDNAASFAAGRCSPHNAIINPALFSSFNDFSNADPLQNENALVAFHFHALFPFQDLTEKHWLIMHQHFRHVLTGWLELPFTHDRP